MWKIKITYTDKSSLTISGKHKDIPVDLAVEYYNKYVANHVVYGATYQQYPKKDHEEMELIDKIEELWKQEEEDEET